MRQNQVLHMGIPGDLPNHRRWHMQPPLNPSSPFWHGVVSDEQIRVRCQFRKTSLTVRVSAKHHQFAVHFYPPCQGRDSSMNHADRIRRKIPAVKSRLLRARLKLRDLLQPYFQGSQTN